MVKVVGVAAAGQISKRGTSLPYLKHDDHARSRQPANKAVCADPGAAPQVGALSSFQGERLTRNQVTWVSQKR